MFGITPTGFQKRTLEDLLAQVATDQQSSISANLDTSSSSPVGQINAVLMKAVSELWDLAQAVYDGFDPDKNEGDAQDAVAAITGTKRIAAAPSQVRMSLGLNATTTVPVGSLVSELGSPDILFKLVGSEATPGMVVPGDVASTTAGTYFARFECTKTGPIAAPAGTLTVIVTAVTGWNSATNAADADLGRDVETADDMRQRREDELAAEGTSPVDEIRAELLKLTGMVQANVFENVGDVVDGDGRPPHSVEALVFDGPSPTVADNTIAQTIWDSKAGGIQTFGSTPGTATDSQGNPQTIKFNRPTQVPIYFTISVSVGDGFPGDTALKAAIVAFGQTHQGMGDDVILASFYGPVFAVGGVLNLTSFKAGFAPSPSGTTDLAIAARNLATFDTSRIVIIHV